MDFHVKCSKPSRPCAANGLAVLVKRTGISSRGAGLNPGGGEQNFLPNNSPSMISGRKGIFKPEPELYFFTR